MTAPVASPLNTARENSSAVARSSSPATETVVQAILTGRDVDRENRRVRSLRAHDGQTSGQCFRATSGGLSFYLENGSQQRRRSSDRFRSVRGCCGKSLPARDGDRARWPGASAEAFAAGLGPPFQAGIGAVVCRQSFSRLCVAVISRHSDRAADLPRRWKRSQRRLNLVSAKTGSIMPWRLA